MRGKEIRHPDFGGLRLEREPVHVEAVKAQNVDLRKPGLLSKRPGLRRLNQIHYGGTVVCIGDVQRICDYGKLLVLGDPNFQDGSQVYEHGSGVGGGLDDPAFDPYYAPVAVANGAPLTGVAPLAVAFSSAGSWDPNGGPLTYTWDFGDGSTSNTANPSHQYAADGNYTASLTVTNTAGKTATDAVAVVVDTPWLYALGTTGSAYSSDGAASWNLCTGAPTTGYPWYMVKSGSALLIFDVSATCRVFRSTNKGQNFALYSSFAGTVAIVNPPIVLASGRILVSCGVAGNFCVAYSDNGGLNWNFGGPVAAYPGAQRYMSLLQTADGTVVASYWDGATTRIKHSADEGVTWGPVIYSGSPASAVAIWELGGNLYTYRLPFGSIVVARSADRGASWADVLTFVPAGGNCSMAEYEGTLLFAASNQALLKPARVWVSVNDGLAWTGPENLPNSLAANVTFWYQGCAGGFFLGAAERRIWGTTPGAFAEKTAAPAGIGTLVGLVRT